ncbi:MAG: hypothetical protein ACE5O2_00500 [Armatimonadota bacterium]
MRLVRGALFGGTLVVAASLLVGCGGAGDRPPIEGPLLGSISGHVMPGRGLTGVTIFLDGLELLQHPASDGSFAINGVPVGRHTLCFVGDDGNTGAYAVADVRAAHNTDVGDVPLVLGGQIAGIVSAVRGNDATGIPEPVVGARVEAIPLIVIQPQAGPLPPDPGPARLVAFTDSFGSYLMQGVPRGPYEVRVIVPRLSPGIKFVTVEPMQTTVADFRLHPVFEPGVGTIEGHVYGEMESDKIPIPLKGALVTVILGDPYMPPIDVAATAETNPAPTKHGSGPNGEAVPPIEIAHLSTLTNGDGYYTINVPAGYHHMIVLKQPYLPGYDTVAVGDAQTVIKDFVLVRGPHITAQP